MPTINIKGVVSSFQVNVPTQTVEDTTLWRLFSQRTIPNNHDVFIKDLRSRLTKTKQLDVGYHCWFGSKKGLSDMISPEPSFSKNSTPPEITRLLQQELIWFAPLQLEIVSEDNKKIICFEWPQLASTSSFSSTIEKLLPGLKESYREKIRLILLHSTDPVVQINENAMEFIR